MLRQVTPQFYILTRKGETWSPDKLAFLKKYNLKDIFHPIPTDFIYDAIRGYYYEDQCITLPCKMVMFNFDTKNGARQTLRGIVGVDFKVDDKQRTYIYIRIIGCKSITNTPAACAKRRHDTVMQTGRDMLEWWQRFALQGNFQYIKLNGMEDVLGFYWKLGWRFNRYPTTKNTSNHKFWNSRIALLNKINKLKIADQCWIEKLRSGILTKYFDRFLEGYYSDTKLGTYVEKDDLYDIYGIKGTRTRHHLGLRYHGYTMFWFPLEN